MVNPIPKFAKNVWSKWNIRGAILISLSLQVFLIVMAPLRKRTRNSILVLLLWSTYLLADYTANFCIGLIANKYGDEDSPISSVNDFLLAFWAPFLLLHLGGPDTITAFALEDNELWLRHMLGLIVQVCLTGYVFLLTLPSNTLWLPTSLVFIAGIIKFAERTRSLQLASVSNFRQSMVRKPDPGPNYAKLMEEYKSRQEAGLPTKIVAMPEIADPFISTDTSQQSHAEPSDNPKNESPNKSQAKEDDAKSNEVSIDTHMPQNEDKDEAKLLDVVVVRDAYRYFDIFKGLVVDMIFSFHERKDSRDYFLERTPTDALRVIEVELNFIYGAFYTKTSTVFTKVGFSFRFMSFCSTVAALVLFVFDQKHGCDKFDVKVTYILLVGAVALDVVSWLMIILSDSCASFNSSDSKNRFVSGITKLKDSIFRCYLQLNRAEWTDKSMPKSPSRLQKGKKILHRKLLCRRWSESISGFNLIAYCLCKRQHWVDKVIDYIGAKEMVEQWKYEKKRPLLQDLWIFIFEELKRKSGDADDVETIQRICSSRGAWVIQEGELRRSDINKLMPYVDPNIVTFDQCVILWHIATDLLFYEVADDKKSEKSCFSKILSDYMLYLLIMQPTMMSAVRGIGQIRFQDTCAETINFFSVRGMLEKEREKERDKASSKRNTLTQAKDMWNKFFESVRKFIRRINPFSTHEKEKEMEKNQKNACKKLIDVCVDQDPSSVKGDRSKSLLFDACRLVTELKEIEGKDKWITIAQVWVELLSYAAANCVPITHVQQLSKGGEFLSLVWLLMTHLGLAKQFQIKEGHARAKLIVGEEDAN